MRQEQETIAIPRFSKSNPLHHFSIGSPEIIPLVKNNKLFPFPSLPNKLVMGRVATRADIRHDLECVQVVIVARVIVAWPSCTAVKWLRFVDIPAVWSSSENILSALSFFPPLYFSRRDLDRLNDWSDNSSSTYSSNFFFRIFETRLLSCLMELIIRLLFITWYRRKSKSWI